MNPKAENKTLKCVSWQQFFDHDTLESFRTIVI